MNKHAVTLHNMARRFHALAWIAEQQLKRNVSFMTAAIEYERETGHNPFAPFYSDPIISFTEPYSNRQHPEWKPLIKTAFGAAVTTKKEQLEAVYQLRDCQRWFLLFMAEMDDVELYDFALEFIKEA